ncbi:hypothetical protein [Nostoc sp.]|uniref:hypothetical protein n=1 Tax=Nostoc sp. TaxID=1180 RepID=UPI002FF5BAEA
MSSDSQNSYKGFKQEILLYLTSERVYFRTYALKSSVESLSVKSFGADIRSSPLVASLASLLKTRGTVDA